MREHSLVFSTTNILALRAGHQVSSRRPYHPDLESANACPNAEPGDRILCREPWRPYVDPDLGPGIKYAADGAFIAAPADAKAWCSQLAKSRPWWPAYRLPAWAVRTILTYIAAPTERLHDITRMAAIEEGIEPRLHRCPLELFANHWRRTYGEQSGHANPLVRIVRFERFNPVPV